MSRDGTGPAMPTAARVLAQLLTSEERYRRQWRAHVQRRSPKELHQGAVAAVLAAHLWDTGAVAEDDHDLPRRMKDVVSRALAGRALSARTVGQLVEAFDLAPEHAAALWRAYETDRSAAADRVRGATAYRTLQLDDHHVLGPDGIPVRHTTLHTIEALEPMDRFSYRFDTSAASVTVARGGTPGPVYATEQDGLFGIDIAFPVTLEPGSTRVLEYTTHFDYAEAPPPEFRRAVRSTVGSVSIQVQFDPGRLPARVLWARWADLAGPPEPLREVPLDDEQSVTEFERDVTSTIIGFAWQWE